MGTTRLEIDILRQRLRHYAGTTLGMEGLVVGEGVEVMGDVVLHDFGDIDVLVEHVHGNSPG